MKIDSEELVFNIVAMGGKSKSKGDLSKVLKEQGFFDSGSMPRSLKTRDELLSGGNPIDIKKEFFKQNPN